MTSTQAVPLAEEPGSIPTTVILLLILETIRPFINLSNHPQIYLCQNTLIGLRCGLFDPKVTTMSRSPNPFHFSAASSDEALIFGACRPGYPSHSVNRTIVNEWTHFMQTAGIERVVCLLDQSQLAYYDDLVSNHRTIFGSAKVLWAPVHDYQLPPLGQVRDTILPFVREALQANEKTVIHCSAGCGRTGFVLAACLVALRGMSNDEAIASVASAGRDACESGDPEVETILNACRAS